MDYFLGIDPARKGFHAWALMDGKKAVYECDKSNTNEGLLKQLEEVRKNFEGDGNRIWVGIDDGHEYLTELLYREGFDRIYQLNSAKLSAYKRINDLSGGKWDALDASVAGEYLVENRRKLKQYRPPTELERQARILAEGMEGIRECRIQAWQRFWAVTDYIAPEMSRLKLNFDANYFTDAMDLLGRCRNMGAKAMLSFCKKRKSGAKPKELEKLLACMKKLEKHGNMELIKLQARNIRGLNEEDKAWEKKARSLLATWEKGMPLFTINRFGPKTGVRFLAYIGEDWREVKVEKLSAYAGAAPVLKGSGTPDRKTARRLRQKGKKPKQERRQHRLACNKSLKTALCLFTLYSMESHPWARESYDSMRARGQKHWEALRNLSIKWLRIMVHIMQNNLVYDADLHSANQRIRKTQPAA